MITIGKLAKMTFQCRILYVNSHYKGTLLSGKGTETVQGSFEARVQTSEAGNRHASEGHQKGNLEAQT